MHLTADISADIEVTLGILLEDIDRWGNEIILDGTDASEELHTTSGTEQVTRHRLRGTHHETILRVITETMLDRLRLTDITKGGRSAMRIDVLDLLGLEASVIKRHIHAARSALALRHRGS